MPIFSANCKPTHLTQASLVILLPVYNDWTSLQLLLSGLKAALPPEYGRCHIVAVDDGSEEEAPEGWAGDFDATLIRLTHNIGHQKAIAIGLSHAHHNLSFDRLMIMDSDGEDRPEDAVALLRAAGPKGLVVARRTSRQEGLLFRSFYRLYKALFYLLTGKRIAFGNFMLMDRANVATMVHYSEIWNHLAGAVIKSRLPYKAITTHRGRRYAGRSKMNFNGLLLHGLGAIGVFIERIASRLLLLSVSLIFVSLLAIGITVFIKLFTTQAIPGWATTAVSSMLIVLLQSFLLSLFTIFLYLSAQGQRKFIPAHHYTDYVQSINQKNRGE